MRQSWRSLRSGTASIAQICRWSDAKGRTRARARPLALRLADSLGLMRHEVERGRQVLRVLVALTQRIEPETGLDQLQNGGRIIDRVVDETLLGEGRDDDRGNAQTGPPAVDDRRRHVVPEAPILVESYDHHRVRPDRALLDKVQHLPKMLVALEHVGITGMLVELANGLVESDRGKGPVDYLPNEISRVFEVTATPLGVRGVFLEISKGLVVGLKILVRVIGDSVIPSTGVPSPVDSLVAQLVANRRHILQRQRRLIEVRRVERLKRVDRIAVIGHLVGLLKLRDEVKLVIKSFVRVGFEAIWSAWCVLIARRAGADHPKMVQERSAEGSMKEMVGERVPPRIVPKLGAAPVVKSHSEAAGIGVGSELIHESAVDLRLLIEEAMDQVARWLANRNVSVDAEGLVRQPLRKARVDG